MERRAYLATAGILLTSTAGCLQELRGAGGNSNGDEDGGENNVADSDPGRHALGDSATLGDGSTMTVSNPTVQKSVIADHSIFLSIEREAGLQFVVIDVESNAEFDPSSFVLELDGQIKEPPRIQQVIRAVVRECEATCIAIPLAAEAVDEAAVVYLHNGEPMTKWELDEDTITAFPQVPDLRLLDAGFATEDGDIAIEFTVENVGEHDGGFRALVSPAWVADVSDPVGFPVAPDETVTEVVTTSELGRLSPEEAAFTHEITADTRRFEVDSA